MARIGIISNPLSHRNRREIGAIREVVSRHPDVLHAELSKIADLTPILAEFARRDVGLVVVSGGDGTVQATLTALVNDGPFDPLPRLAVLPTGMTNLIALDVGLRGRRDRALDRLLASGGGGERMVRRTLALTYAADKPPVHGMFFGAGAFYRGTMLGREKIHPLGIEQSAAAGAALMMYLLRLLWRRRSGTLFREEIAALFVDGERVGGKYFIALATTLDRLLLGLWPFWGDGRGAVRYTAAACPPRRLGRALIPLLRGRPRPWMAESGYLSGVTDRLRFTTDGPVVLDGEIFTPAAGAAVELAGGPAIEFLRC